MANPRDYKSFVQRYEEALRRQSDSPRAETNRANAQLSTGPRTPEGKSASSLNALRHGLTAQSPVIPGEDAAAYDAFVKDFLDSLKPSGALERELVLTIADTSWRLNRASRLESGALAANAEDSLKLLNSLSTHAQRLSRQREKAIQQVRQIQADRRHAESSELASAAAIYTAHNRRREPWNPGDFGFVFSNAELDAHIRRAAWSRTASLDHSNTPDLSDCTPPPRPEEPKAA